MPRKQRITDDEIVAELRSVISITVPALAHKLGYSSVNMAARLRKIPGVELFKWTQESGNASHAYTNSAPRTLFVQYVEG